MTKLNEQKIPKWAQRLMDSDMNCCFNCTDFKLCKGVKTFTSEDYKNLKARCTCLEAVKESILRERIVGLGIFSHAKVRFPESRVNCKFFELA